MTDAGLQGRLAAFTLEEILQLPHDILTGAKEAKTDEPTS